MESYVGCKVCGEKTSTNFSYCMKCGAELLLRNGIPESSQENNLSLNTQEKTDVVQLATSENTEISHREEEREIITELEHLRNSQLTGRIVYLLHQLEKLPVLSKKTYETLRHFKTHKDDDVKITAKRILVQRFAEKIQLDPVISRGIDKRLDTLDRRYGIQSEEEISYRKQKGYDFFSFLENKIKPIFFGFWLLLSLLSWVYLVIYPAKPLRVEFLDLTFDFWTTIDNLDSNNIILYLFGIISTVLSSIIIAIVSSLVVFAIGAIVIVIISYGIFFGESSDGGCD